MSNMETFGIIFLLFTVILFLIFEIYAMYKSYEYAGIKGWKSIIPIWNILSLFCLANLSTWMIILVFVPGVNLYINYLVYSSLADRLGHKRIFGLGLLLLPFIFFPILAFTNKESSSDIYNEFDEESETKLMDGPIEPLGAMPDLNELYNQDNNNYEYTNYENTNGFPTSYNEITQEVINNPEIVVDEIAPVVPFKIENPLGAMAKVQYVEEEKEKIPSMDEYKVCPNCGTKLDSKATTCFLCGKILDE